MSAQYIRSAFEVYGAEWALVDALQMRADVHAGAFARDPQHRDTKNDRFVLLVALGMLITDASGHYFGGLRPGELRLYQLAEIVDSGRKVHGNGKESEEYLQAALGGLAEKAWDIPVDCRDRDGVGLWRARRATPRPAPVVGLGGAMAENSFAGSWEGRRTRPPAPQGGRMAMQFPLYTTREFSTGILVALLKAGFNVGPVWSALGDTSGNDVECFNVSGEDVGFYGRLKAAIEESGFSFDYRGAVFPATGFGAIVKTLNLSERDQARLSEFLVNQELIATQEDHELVAAYEAEYRARKLYHANLVCASREMRLRSFEANPPGTGRASC